MSTPIQGVRYSYDAIEKQWEAPGRTSLTAVVTPPATGPGYLPPLSPTTLRATGNWVDWSDLVQSGDGVTTSTDSQGGTVWDYPNGRFQTIANRCPANKGILFDLPGTHVINSVGWGSGAGAFRMPKTCIGLVGTVPPGTGWGDIRPTTQRVTLRVKAMTSPEVNVPGAWFQCGFTGSVRFDIANIHFEGTEQGNQVPGGTGTGSGPGNDGTSPRLFTNFFGWNQAKGCTARDILTTGWYGNNGAPPGETFGFEWYHSTDGVCCRINSDGRRAAGGRIYGAVGFTFGYAVNCVARDIYSHHNGFGGYVEFQTANCRTYDMVLGDPSDHTTTHITTNQTKGDWLNHERTTGAIHYDTVMNTYAVNRSQLVPITHSGDAFSFTQDGATFSTTNGTFEMVDPIYTGTLFGGEISIDSWGPSYGGNPSTYLDGQPVPYLHKRDGTRLPIRWDYGSGSRVRIT